MFKPLVMPSENTGIDFLNKTLNGKSLMEFQLNPPIGNQHIITDKISAKYYFIILKVYTQENSKTQK